MLRTIVSVIVTIFLIIVAFVAIRWGIEAYRVNTTGNVVATVCTISPEHAFTSAGAFNADPEVLKSLRPGQSYSFYIQKEYPWEYPTIIGLQPAGSSVTNGGDCGPVQPTLTPN